MALENQRYGRNKDTLVNRTYIESGEYRRKYDNATDNPAVNKTLYACAKKALRHRSGTVLEDMYWIDGNTGEVILAETDCTVPRGIPYTDRIKKAVRNKNNIVTLHTHPSSMPPSAADFNSCFKNGYLMGFIACHNGTIYAYIAEQEINERLYDAYTTKFFNECHDEFEAQIMTLRKMMKNHKIYFWEVNPK